MGCLNQSVSRLKNAKRGKGTLTNARPEKSGIGELGTGKIFKSAGKSLGFGHGQICFFIHVVAKISFFFS